MFNFELTERGYLRKHESSDLEYKENFHRGDEMLRCQGDGEIRTVVTGPCLAVTGGGKSSCLMRLDELRRNNGTMD